MRVLVARVRAKPWRGRGLELHSNLARLEAFDEIAGKL